ncbi:hypothetical protein C1646_777121 [Rhizophagus diaphanus]|nr:hypothetical protein C1646_777121 [Rhizophagus diaphanus] [Rhizophagus sp. MUCL 43196]
MQLVDGVLVPPGYLKDLTKVTEENKNLQENFEYLLKMRTHKNLEVEEQNKILAEEQQNLLNHNINLKSSRSHAEAAYEKAKELLYEQYNIILTNISTSYPSIEKHD